MQINSINNGLVDNLSSIRDSLGIIESNIENCDSDTRIIILHIFLTKIRDEVSRLTHTYGNQIGAVHNTIQNLKRNNSHLPEEVITADLYHSIEQGGDTTPIIACRIIEIRVLTRSIFDKIVDRSSWIFFIICRFRTLGFSGGSLAILRRIQREVLVFFRGDIAPERPRSFWRPFSGEGYSFAENRSNQLSIESERRSRSLLEIICPEAYIMSRITHHSAQRVIPFSGEGRQVK